MPIIHARPDPMLAARVVRSLPLVYAEGPDPALDRPPHVRAASGLVRAGSRLVVIQDDANFVALVDPATGLADAITLPAGEGGLRQFGDERGNKRYKLDLETCVMLPDENGREMLAAFGSGSSERRETIVVIRGIASDAPEVRRVDASTLYARLRDSAEFAGSEMNVEGAAVTGGALRLFNRGNGASREGRDAVNASCDLDLAAFLAYLADPASAPPPPRSVARYELGEVDGQPLGFTDVSVRGDAILYAAAAEDSPDATRDGPVAGCAIGIIRGGQARFAVVRDADGGRYDSKIEGICPHPGDPARLWAVTDRDDPGTPSELLEIELSPATGV